MAQRVGPHGTIYAIDVRQEALDAARTKMKLFRLTNIDLIRADLEMPHGTGLKDESVDKTVITNILFQVHDKNALVREASRILRPDGSLLLVEWSDDTSGGPVLPGKVTRKEAEKLCADAGFSTYKDFYAGSHHYGIIFKRSQ